jgi:hypothetical protein
MKTETKFEKVPSLARLCRHIEAANNNPGQTIEFIKELEIDAIKISKAIPQDIRIFFINTTELENNL